MFKYKFYTFTLEDPNSKCSQLSPSSDNTCLTLQFENIKILIGSFFTEEQLLKTYPVPSQFRPLYKTRLTLKKYQKFLMIFQS